MSTNASRTTGEQSEIDADLSKEQILAQRNALVETVRGLRARLSEMEGRYFEQVESNTMVMVNAGDAIDDFRERAVELCKQKAAEWQALFGGDVSGDHDDKVYFAKAANELADALEELEIG